MSGPRSTPPAAAPSRLALAAPKVELHLHLEGAIRPRTLLQLAARNDVELPSADEAGLAAWTRFRDFEHFIQVYVLTSRCLRGAADFEQVTVELAAELAAQNARYAEVTVSPSTHVASGVAADDLLGGLDQGRRRALAEHGVTLAWVFDLVRSHSDPAERVRRADLALGLALDGRATGVVALGLGGLERGYPAAEFAPWFDRARAAGLRSVPHAGELDGPDSVRQALDRLGADRIGHGVRAVEDPALVARLARAGVPLEVNPTSNLRLGVVGTYAEHPLPALLRAGVRVVVGSDDPALFGTTLAAEVTLLERDLGLAPDEVDRVLLEGVRASFLPEERKRTMEAEHRAAIAALRAAGA